MVRQSGKSVDGVKFWSVLRYGEVLVDGNIKTALSAGSYSLVESNEVRRRVNAIADEFFEVNKGEDVTVVLSSLIPLIVYSADVIGRRCASPFYITDVMAKLYFEEVDDLIYEEKSFFRKHYGEDYWQMYEVFKKYCDQMIDSGFQFKKIPDPEMRGVIEETIKSGDAYYSKFIDAINDKNVLVLSDRIMLEESDLESWRIINTYYSPKSVSVMTIFPLADNRNVIL